ncbi:MAG: response regulator [Actinomycetota bacterium]
MEQLKVAPARVLIVEDEPDVVELIKINLAFEGYETSAAYDGASALVTIKKDPPDLVLLDIMLPGTDGWEVLRLLKADDATAHLPVVVVTARTGEEDRIRGTMEGALFYVTKPFVPGELLRAVADALEPRPIEERERMRTVVLEQLEALARLERGEDPRAPSHEPRVHLTKLEHRQEAGPAPPPTPILPPVDLTPRQRDLVLRLAAGHPVRDVAADLGVSRTSVYATLRRIARKLHVPSERVVQEAIDRGVVTEEDPVVLPDTLAVPAVAQKPRIRQGAPATR